MSVSFQRSVSLLSARVTYGAFGKIFNAQCGRLADGDSNPEEKKQ